MMLHRPFIWLSILAVVLPSGLSADLGHGDEEVCLAGKHCSPPSDTLSQGSAHYWPHTRGQLGHYAVSAHSAPVNLTAASRWSWAHPGGRFHTMPSGSVIDNQRNIYTSSRNGLHKLSPAGQLLWSADVNSSAAPMLEGDKVFVTGQNGYFYSVSMATGEVLWAEKVCDVIGADIHGVGVHKGIVIAPTHGNQDGGDSKLTAVSAASGEVLWDFAPDSQLWNFMPFFTQNDTLVFQDQAGGVYHVAVRDGSLLWKAGYSAGWDDTWTDGTPMLAEQLGEHGIVYAVHLPTGILNMTWDSPGDLSAYRLSDGELLWRQHVPFPPNSQPLVVKSRDRHVVVMPIGAQAVVPWWFILAAVFAVGAIPGLLGGLFCWALRGLYCCLCRRGSKPAGSRCRLVLRYGCCGLILGGCGLAAFVTFHIWGARSLWTTTWPAELWAFDAETGVEQWRWAFPSHSYGWCAGDLEGLFHRVWNSMQPVCLPTPYGSPSAGPDGTIYISYMDGKAYAISDLNGDNRIDSDTEVFVADIFSASNIPGTALAPGMVVFTTCDMVHAFYE